MEQNLGLELSWTNRFLLAKQVRRFYTELGCILQSDWTNLRDATVRAAFLWMEEFGPEIWPPEIEKRGHLSLSERDPAFGFVYARDRNGSDYTSQEHIESVSYSLENSFFQLDHRGLNPMNKKFEGVVRYFKDVFDQLWDFDSTPHGWPERTAGELFCIIFRTPLWTGHADEVFCPLFYLHENRARNCEHDESSEFVCECHIR